MKRRSVRALLVPGLLAAALLIAATVLAMQMVFLNAGNAAWERHDHVDAERQYTRSMNVSVLNKWIPVHNRGVARYERKSWDASADDFEQAAGLAPAEQQCAVRLNWSFALESGADALREADDVSGAMVRYSHAEVVLAEADCSDETASNAEALSEAWSEARQRVESKKTDGAATWTPPEEPSDSKDSTEELEERTQQAQEERQRAEEQEGQDPEEGSSGERNW